MTTAPDNFLEVACPRLVAGDPFPAREDLPAACREAISRHGVERGLASLKGNFALAWREPDGRIVLAVDRFASRTLCYRLDALGLSVGPRADGLGADTNDLDAQALFDYLYFHVIPSPRTVFAQVRRLAPGHCAVLEQGRLVVKPYSVATFNEVRKPDFGDLREEFLHLLRGAVKRQLDGSRPACFLSGGTDSSTVAGMIGQVCGQPAATYSIGFEAEGYDEMAYARIAAQRFGTEHHEYYVTPDDLVRGIADVAGHYDQPFGNSSALPAYYCAVQARDNGVTRILAGDGGDELFGGNSRYATQEIFGWYQRVPEALRRGALEPFFGVPWVGRVPLLKKGTGYIRQARTPLPERLQTFNLLRRLGYKDVLTPQFRAQIDPGSVSRQQQQVWDATQGASEINRHLAYDWRYTLAENDLPKVRGTASMADIDVAFPMLDDDLLAFSMRLPSAYKLRGRRLRWFFKEALRGFLPDEIITKKKQGFGLPFGVWLMRHERLRELATDSLRSFAGRGVVEPDFVRRLLDTHLPEHPHYYGSMVWILMMLEQWLLQHAPKYKLGA
jgi:asparagine synthase (glutamine-hydrolysing)